MSDLTFYKDKESKSVIKNLKDEHIDDVLVNWDSEVVKYVENFNSFKEDRNAVIYFALFVEFHINKTLCILYPDFDKLLSYSKTSTSIKINLLDAFRLFPKQIFESCRCINHIRNEFAHEISIISFEQLSNLEGDRKKKTIDKLIEITDNYTGDYDYHVTNNTIGNRFKALCLNTISAIRIYEPQVIELRQKIDN